MGHILVTGGSGRLGREICRLLQSEHRVVVYDVAPPRNPDLGFVQGDLLDEGALARAMDGVDAVIHLAAIPIYNGDDPGIMRVNVMGSFNVIFAAARAGVRKFIGASSICAQGWINWSQPFMPPYLPADEDLDVWPDDAYGLSKLFLEQMARAYARKYGMQAICLRLATVWDPGGEPERRERLTAPLRNPDVGYDFLWNYVDLRDVAAAFSLALERLDTSTASMEVFHIGAGETACRIPTRELLRRYFPDVPLLKGPRFLAESHAPLWCIDRAREVLGFTPKHHWREHLSE